MYKLLSLIVTSALFMSHATATPHLEPRSPEEVRAVAEGAVRQLIKTSSNVRVTRRLDRIGPALLLKLNTPLLGERPREQALSFIQRYGSLWGRAQVSISSITERRGRAVAVLTAEIDRLPLIGQQSRLSIRDGRAQHLSNGIGALGEVVRARVTEAKAKTAALQRLSGQVKVASTRRVAMPLEPGRALEVFEVRLADATRLRSWVALVDGRDGAVIQVREGELK